MSHREGGGVQLKGRASSLLGLGGVVVLLTAALSRAGMVWAPEEGAAKFVRRLPISSFSFASAAPAATDIASLSPRNGDDAHPLNSFIESVSRERFNQYLAERAAAAPPREAQPQAVHRAVQTLARVEPAPATRTPPRRMVVTPPVTEDFSAGLGGWTTTGDVTMASGEAIVGDNNTEISRLSRAYELGAGTFTVEFDYKNDMSDAYQPGHTFPDTFFASLYFTSDTNSFDIDGGQFAASQKLMDLDYQGAFNVDGTVGSSLKGVDWQHFTGTFTTTNQYWVLAFELNDLNQENNDSSARLDNIRIVPEPGSWCLALFGLMALPSALRRRRAAKMGVMLVALGLGAGVPAGAQTPPMIDLSRFCHVVTTNERSTLNRQTGEVTTTLNAEIYNLSQRAVLAPFHVAVNLSASPVQVVGALGGTNVPPYNTFYFDLSSQLQGGVLPNGGKVGLSLTFKRPRDVQFSYTLVPYGRAQPEHPPALFVSPLSYSINEGQTAHIAAYATDVDTGDVVVVSATPMITNMTLAVTNGNPANATLEFQPDFDQAGIYSVMFRARDQKGYEAIETVQITVSNVNRAPVADAVPPQSVKEGGFLSFALGVTDPDNDPLSFTLVNLPTNAVFNPEARMFFWSPNFEQAGSYAPQFIASDGALSVTQTVSISVSDVVVAPPNDTNAFTLSVNPIQSPTFQQRTRVTGTVNGSTNGPPPAPAAMALINGVVPSVGLRGQTTNVTLTGQGSGAFAVHFAQASSVPNFGEGISVNSITVVNPTQLIANITIDAAAALGPRAPTVQTENELAAALVAFNVQKGETSLSGKIVDSDTTNGVAGAVVSIEGTGISTTTALDGSFTLHNIPPGAQVLIINSPNHELIRIAVNGDDPNAQQLGSIATRATVFDPNAPAAVSLLSVLGRGIGAFGETKSMSEARKAIVDALLVAGGTEAGVMDEFGNQLNPKMSGAGLMSTLPDGVRKMAEHQDRGESVALYETLYAFTYGWTWTNGAPWTLADWMEALQAQINKAWADPNNPSNALAILIFNPTPTLSPRPPEITPATRLNPVQNYLFVMSMLSYASIGTNAEFASAAPAIRGHLLADRKWPSFVSSAYADPPSNVPPQRAWTSYWRGMSQAKNNFFELTLANAATDLAKLSGVLAAVAASADMRVGVLALPMIGHYGTEIVAALGALAMAARVPETPKMVGHVVFEGPRRQTNEPGIPRVKVRFRRSVNDEKDGRYMYSLYRFRNFDEGRQLVAMNSFHQEQWMGSNTLELIDQEPFYGSTFYAVTVARLYTIGDQVSDNELNNTTPFWNQPLHGINPVGAFIAAKQMLVSDYSDPTVVYVGSPASMVEVSDIELNPKTGHVYYSDKSGTAAERQILDIDLNTGEYKTLATTQFADPGQEGLAVDANGDIYMLNKASEAMFGGRLFRFNGASGARTHVGQVNYYSRDLFFANPTDAYALDMGPAAFLAAPNQDLYFVDLMAGQVKRAPVMAEFDPFRRVGQPYADYPYSSRPTDMEHDALGSTFILVPEALPRRTFNDREKGPMHRPPGAPIKIDCPPSESNPFIDPVYLHSGEYYQDDNDITIRGVGLDFTWVRKYRSKIGTNTVQGNNWDFSYNIYITKNTNTGGIVVNDGHTRSDEYQRSGTNNLWTLREFFRELSKNNDDTYTLEFEDKGVWKFYGFTGAAADGRIKESVDRHGNRLQFFYDGLGRLIHVVDTLNRDIFIAYNGAGFISDISDFAGRTWRYEYYGPSEAGGNPGDLKSMRTPAITGMPNGNDFPSGRTVTYTYSKGFADERLNGNLLTVTDAKGQTFLENTYATNSNPDDLYFDRVVKQRWGDSADTVELCYIPVNPTPANGNAVIRVILNDRVGHVKEYFYNAFNQATIERVYTGTAANNQVTTDTQNRPINKLRPTDPDYFETRYEWNADSLKKREIHPNGNITEWIYEGELSTNVTARTRGNIRVVRHLPGSYATPGDQPVIEERYEYDTSYGRGCCGFNFATKITDGRGNHTYKSYSPQGDLTQVVQRISSIVEKYEYDGRGRVVKITAPDNGSGHHRVDRFVFYGPADGIMNGYLKQTIQDDGGFNITTTYEYDSRGNPIRIIDPRGNDTLTVFNQLDEVVRANSAEVKPGVRYYSDSFFDANGNVVRSDRVNMDEFGNIVATNPLLTSTAEFDILNTKVRQTEEVDPAKTVTVEYQFDGNRNLLLTRYGSAVSGSQPFNVSRTVYDERDLPFRLTDAAGAPEQMSTQVDYDRNGNAVRTTVGLEHAAPRVATRVFDAFDRKVRETDSMGNVSIWRYDANNNATQFLCYAELHDAPGGVNNVRQREMSFVMDDMNRQVETRVKLFDPATQAPVGGGENVAQTFYNDIGLVARMVDDRGSEAHSVYDRLGRLSEAFDPLSNSLKRVYDANGNELAIISTERSPTGGPTRVYVVSNSYDKLNRMIQTVDNGGNTNQIFYDSRHNVARTVDARGNVTRYEFDGMGRRLRTIYELTSDGTGSGSPAGQIVLSQTFDDSSRLRSRTDGNGNTTTYDVDSQGRVVRVNLPDGRSTRTYYDVLDNVISNVDAVGTVEAMQYDLGDRLVRRDVYPASGVATDTTYEVYQYDGMGRTVRAENNRAVTERSFDSASRLISETQDGQTLGYTYDGRGNLQTVLYPGGRMVTNTFDAMSRLTVVADTSGPIATYVYDGLNRIVQRDYANHTRATVEYDATKHVTRVKNVRDPSGANVTLDDRRFTWDRTFNKTSRADLPAAETNAYSYDSVNRMIASVKTGPQAISYHLDAAGNRLSVTGGPSAGIYMRSAAGPEPRDAQVNQYTATPFDQRAYDANGNTTGINTGQPSAKLYAYDYRNRLVRFENPALGVVVSFTYDASGRRIRKAVSGGSPSDTRYVYDGLRIVEEQNAGHTTTATYVYGNYIDERLTMRRGGQDYYYHGDDLHNVTKLTDASGAVVEQYAYGDFGQPSFKDGGGAPLAHTAVGNPYLFTGREFDPETGLYFYRTRYLDPMAGRFISRDTIGAWGDPSGMGNGNTYAGNNPWTLTDPAGMSSAEFAGGVVVGGAQGVVSVAGGIIGAPGFLAVGAVNVVLHPVNSWNGLCATMTKVAFHPDGIAAGWAHVLAPDMLRKAECWEFISDYERGKFYGQYGAEAIGLVAGGGINSAAGKVGRMLKLRGLQWYRANRPFAKPAWLPTDTKVRKGLEWRTDAGFSKFGQMTPGEYEFFRQIAVKEGRSFAVVGGTVETRLGYQRRLAAITDEAVRNEFPRFRIEGKTDPITHLPKTPEQNLKSGLLEGTSDEFDVDVWMRSKPGEDHATLQLSESSDAAIREKFKIKKVDYYNEYGNYPDETAVKMRCGGIEFHPDGTSTRLNAPWQEDVFINKRDVYPDYDKM